MTRLCFLFFVVMLPCVNRFVQAQTSEDVLQATSVRGGIAVHLGATDGKLELDLAASGRLLVQGLALDPVKRDHARRAIDRAQRYGLATVQQVDSYSELPYASDLVNLVVADFDRLGLRLATAADTRTAEQREILRVLRPDGAAYLKVGGRPHGILVRR